MYLPRIAVDLCNTLADVNSLIDDLTDIQRPFGIYEHPGVTAEYFINHPNIYGQALVLDDAVEGLNELSKFYNVTYLTKRDISSRYITEKWLSKNNFPDGELVFSKDKVLDFFKLNCLFAIEDAPFELSQYDSNGITYYAKAWDYNTLFPRRFKSFDILINNIIAKEVIL